MASISGFGNFGGIDPTQRFTGAKAPVPQKQAESAPAVAGDAVQLSGAPAAEVAQAPAAPVASAAPAEARASSTPAAPERARVPVTLSMEDASSIGSVGLGTATPAKFEAFTNGLNSTSFTGLSGNIIAGARPFGSFN